MNSVVNSAEIGFNKLSLHYAFHQPSAHGYGWATCNNSLIKELQDHFVLVDDHYSADVCFMPLADHNLSPAASATGKIRLAYTFFESPLGPEAKANALRHDTVFCGSSWCLDRMKEAGIINGKVLIQGVDAHFFKPGERKEDGKYRIFSGGKYEHRKGQDLVAIAFREFLKSNPDAHLVCAWYNPWPHLIPLMAKRNGKKIDIPQEQLFEAYLIGIGIPRHAFTILPQLDQEKLCKEMQNTDVGLFPSRCEGGTNLVLMEYLATGNPAVANIETGHRDLWNFRDDSGAEANIFPIVAEKDSQHWALQNPSNISTALRTARRHGCQKRSPAWTWSATAQKIADEAQRIAQERGLAFSI